MEKVITVDISKSKFLRANPQWQYNHGQKLQFVGVELPSYYEVHFSNSINGEAKKQLGDSSGVLIPFEYFQPGKSIYAWIYTTDNDSGITQRQVEIPIHKKAICTDEEPTPEQSDIIEEAIGALNSALDEVDDRIEAALDSAKQSGEFDGTDGTTIWTTSQAPSYPNYTFIIADLAGTPGAVPKEKDLIFYDLKYYKIINVGETSVLSSLYVDVRDNNVLHKTGDEMLGALSMGANKITNLANGTNNYDAVNLRQVKQMIADEGSTYRGSFNTKAALLAAPWQNVDRELPYYVDNKDFAIVQADESNNNECWRYMYTTGTGWGEQYKINDAPLSQAQIDALNSGITNVKVQKLDTVEPSAEVNIIEEIRVKNPITEQWAALPVTNKGVNLPEVPIQKEVYYPTFTVDELGDELVVTSSSDTPTAIINIATLNDRAIIAKVSYDGSVFYLPLSEAQEDQVLWTCNFAGEIAEGVFLRIQNDELSWVVSIFAAAEDEAVGIALNNLSDAIDSKYTKPETGIPASDLASDVHFVPSGGTIGQVLRKISNNDWDINWDTVNDGEDGSGIWYTTVYISGGENPYVRRRDLVGREGATVQVHDLLFAPDVGYEGAPTTLYEITSVGPACVLNRLCKMQGDDGYSPSASVSKSGDTATITITDQNGMTTATVTDGVDGNQIWWTSASISPSPLIVTDVTRMSGGTGSPKPGDYVIGSPPDSSRNPTFLYSIDEISGNLASLIQIGSLKGTGGVGVPSGGTTGQVLKKASGTDYDTEWADDSSGINDYSDLTNKPQINSVTLSGNKSLSDLEIQPQDFIVTVTYDSGNDAYSANKTFAQIKAARQAGKNIVVTYGNINEVYRLAVWIDDPLEFAVFAFNQGTSVNQIMIDETNFVSLTVGSAYSKPSGGIPATDLASAVQTSLGKADTALQPGDVAEPFFATYSTSDMTTWTCDKTFAQITAAMAAGKQVVMIGSVGGTPIAQGCEVLLADDGSYYTEFWIRYSLRGWYRIVHHEDDTIDFYDDVIDCDTLEAVASDQGVSHAGEFLVVGNDGIVTTMTLATWQGGNY